MWKRKRKWDAIRKALLQEELAIYVYDSLVLCMSVYVGVFVLLGKERREGGEGERGGKKVSLGGKG